MTDDRIARAKRVPIDQIVAPHGITLRRQGGFAVGPCPMCKAGDDRFFVNVEKNLWGCRICDKGGDSIDLVQEIEGCTWDEAVERLAGARPAKSKALAKPDFRHPIAVFYYHAADGRVLYRNVRFPLVDPAGQVVLSKKGKPDKTFVQQHYSEAERRWIKGANHPGVPYRLKDLVEARAREPGAAIYVTEGERKADLLHTWGLVATSIPKNATDFGQWFEGAHVILVADKDVAGDRYVKDVAGVIERHCAVLRRLDLPGLNEGEDIEDWVANGGNKEQFLALVMQTPEFRKKSSGTPSASEDGRDGFSDDALTLRLVDLHGEDLRYVAKMNRWYHWRGSHWEEDRRNESKSVIRQFLRKIALAEAEKETQQKELRSKHAVAAVEALAETDQRIVLTVDDLNPDRWLLNTPGGVVNLRTGELGPHRREDHITKITSATPSAGPICPRWFEFLNRITAGDKELESFLQRMMGYALTGSTQEQSLFFLHGHGANGKSVFIGVTSSILADYHVTAPIETFTDSDMNRHPTELAMLMGARMVTSVETEEGRRWAETRINMLTGGDRVPARFMRQDFFEFTPQFKLIIAGNHKPSLRSVNEAARRRFNLVPFAVTIPKEERDPDLSDKLKGEAPGILRWMIDGCLAWQAQGLNPPAAVIDATAAYLESEDAVAAWIEECCVYSPQDWMTSTDLFNSWSSWATKSGEYVGSLKRFVQKLENRPGLEPSRRRDGRGFSGLRLKGQFD